MASTLGRSKKTRATQLRQRADLLASFEDQQPLGGYHRGLYKYPARFAPDFARAAVAAFTRRDEIVVDPFAGGGTSIVEALAEGRRAVAIDINPLACLLTRVKTTPLRASQCEALMRFCSQLRVDGRRRFPADPRVSRLPINLAPYLVPAVELLDGLSDPDVRRAAKVVLLRMGQWLVESKTSRLPDRVAWSEHAAAFGDDLLTSLTTLVRRAESAGISEHNLLDRRIVLQGSAEIVLRKLPVRWRSIALVLTSPPYPGVHVLYHRWQVQSRRETPAPFWIANSVDGAGPSFYTLGGRHERGLESYFVRIEEAFRVLRRLLRESSHVVQVVSFAKPTEHLPRYYDAMTNAGYQFSSSFRRAYQRKIPGRRWYASSNRRSHGREVLFVLRPTRRSA